MTGKQNGKACVSASGWVDKCDADELWKHYLLCSIFQFPWQLLEFRWNCALIGYNGITALTINVVALTLRETWSTRVKFRFSARGLEKKNADKLIYIGYSFGIRVPLMCKSRPASRQWIRIRSALASTSVDGIHWDANGWPDFIRSKPTTILVVYAAVPLCPPRFYGPTGLEPGSCAT